MPNFTGELRYFFDPLCGWCYASAPALAGLADHYGAALKMMPSGLFMRPRPVAEMADHAWRNDQRIAAITGQLFTEAYRDRVLLDPNGVFDSAPLTKALVALGEIDPALEPKFLHAAQVARYVDGEDTSKAEVAAQVAVRTAVSDGIALDRDEFVVRLLDDAALTEATSFRVDATQSAMRSLPSSGVPQLLVIAGERSHLIAGQDLYSGCQALLDRIASLRVPA